MKWFDNTALTLVIIGALNWLLVGIFKLDIVAVIFGNLTWLSRIIYTIIGTVRFISHQPLWKNWKFILKKGYPYYGCPFYIFTYYFSGIASTIAVISL